MLAAPLLGACTAQDHSEHSPGPVETSGGHGLMSGVHGPTFRSGGRIDHAANGFDPRILLRDFDYGHTSIGPDGRTVREWEVIAEDREIEVAPGVRFQAWTFNGRIPGPTLRCTEGDLLRVRFINRSEHQHTMHFHGIHTAEMDGVPIKSIVSGEPIRAQIRLEGGFEYEVAEVGSGTSRSLSPLEFAHANSYGQFAHIHLDSHGIVHA